MGDDLSTGAKIGIGLVILCFLIAIVLALLMVVKNITNSGANQMESGLNQMMQTTYDDYDQKVVTGTKVTSALKLFQGESMGIIVNTRHNGNNTCAIYGLLLNINGVTTPSTDGVMEGTDTPTCFTPTASANKSGNFIASANAGDVYLYGTNEVPDFRTDQASVYGEIPAKTQFNLNTKPLSAQGTSSYVRSNAKYMSYLIKDSTETIVGIYFVLQDT